MLTAVEQVRIHEDADAWLARQFRSPWVRAHRPLFERWFDTVTDRDEIATQEGLTLGELLRIFNSTAPLESQVPFRYKGVDFAAVAMRGLCDDLNGDRFGRFGEPLTLRVYLTEPGVLPQGMLEAADWNFMDAGREGFVAYAYGTVHGTTLYLAALQSDIAARYSYLFQGRMPPTWVRHGDEVREEDPGELVHRYGGYVPALRRSFQREWAQVVLTAICAWSRRGRQLSDVALLDFALTGEEERPGHQMVRLYRELPRRLAARPREVSTPSGTYRFNVLSLPALEAALRPRAET